MSATEATSYMYSVSATRTFSYHASEQAMVLARFLLAPEIEDHNAQARKVCPQCSDDLRAVLSLLLLLYAVPFALRHR